MLAAFLVLLRSLALICGGHRTVALENLTLRQQLAVFKRTTPRPPLNRRDRLFWLLLSWASENWRTALIVVRPDTVVRWHRQWLRRRWTRRSTPTRVGRPSTTAAIRTLVAQMGAANLLREHRAFTGNCANSVSTFQSEPSRAWCSDAVFRLHKRGAPC
jgi:hypothetical protein